MGFHGSSRGRARISGAWLAVLITASIAAPQAGNRENAAYECFDLMYYQQGIEIAEKILADRPNEPEWRIRQAYAWLHLGKPDQALTALRRESELFPASWEARAFAAALLSKSGAVEEAGRLAREARKNLLDLFPKQNGYTGPGFWPVVYAPGLIDRTLEEGERPVEVAYELEFVRNVGAIPRPTADPRTKAVIVRPLRKAGMWHLPFPAPNAGLPAFVAAMAADSRDAFDEALRLYGEAKRFGYDALACELRRADLLLRASRPAEAEAVILEAMGEGGVQAEAFALLALIRTEKGDRTGALDAIEVASELRPFEKSLLTARAVLTLAADPQSSPGRALLERAVRLDRSDLEAAGWLEDARAGRNVFAVVPPSAMARLRRFLGERLAPRFQYPFHYDLNGILIRINGIFSEYLKSGMLSYAATYLSDFLSVDDRSPQINYNLALLLNSLGQPARAFAYAWRAAALDPQNRDACDLLGNLFLQIRDLEHSVEMYREASGIDPKDPLGHLNLGCALRESGDLERAFGEWRTAIALENPGAGTAAAGKSKSELDREVTVRDNSVSFSAYIAIGAAERGRGRPEEAVAAFMSAAALRPDAPDPWYEIGLVRLGQGFQRDAQSAFDRYASMGGNEAKVRQALAEAKKKK